MRPRDTALCDTALWYPRWWKRANKKKPPKKKADQNSVGVVVPPRVPCQPVTATPPPQPISLKQQNCPLVSRPTVPRWVGATMRARGLVWKRGGGADAAIPVTPVTGSLTLSSFSPSFFPLLFFLFVFQPEARRWGGRRRTQWTAGVSMVLTDVALSNYIILRAPYCTAVPRRANADVV